MWGVRHTVPHLVRSSRLILRIARSIRYSDQLHVLFRWDEGTTRSLRLGSEICAFPNGSEPEGLPLAETSQVEM